jgi:hypothetical protein
VLAIWLQGPVEESVRSTKNVLSPGLEELSCQRKLIWLEETAVAVREVGAENAAMADEQLRVRSNMDSAQENTNLPLIRHLHAWQAVEGSSLDRWRVAEPTL